MEKQPLIVVIIIFFVLASVLKGGCETRSDSHLNLQETNSQSAGHESEDKNDVQFLYSEQIERLDEIYKQLAREREEHLNNSISNYNYILDN